MKTHSSREVPRGTSWQPRILPILLAAVLSGCSVSKKPEEPPERDAANSGPTLVDLEQLARNYSDRLVVRLSSACDQIKQENQDKEAFVKAHELKLTVAMSAYDIITSQGEASNIPSALVRVIDLLILTQLQAIQWIEEDGGRKAFGEQGGEQLSTALAKSWEDVGALASRVFTPEQLDHLKAMVVAWRRENPEAEWLTSIRLDQIAQVKEGEAWLKSLGEGWRLPEPNPRAVDELRLIAQQELFYMKRMPILLDWTLEATLNDMTFVPRSNTRSGEIQGAEGTLAQALESLKELPRHSSPKVAEASEAVSCARELQETPGCVTTGDPARTSPRKEALPGAGGNRSSSLPKSDASPHQGLLVAAEAWSFPVTPDLKRADPVPNRPPQELSGKADMSYGTWGVLMLVSVGLVLEKLLFGVRRIRRRGAPPAPFS